MTESNTSLLDRLTEQELSDFNQLRETSKGLFAGDRIFKNDFTALVRLLGYKDTGAMHIKLMEQIAQQKELKGSCRRLWLWARGHFKTSLITEAHTIWLILNNPDIRVLIVSNTLEIAKLILGNIKKHFIFNEDFRFYFPHFCPIPSKDGKIEFGTTEQFTVPNRKRVLKEPTIMCAGIGTNLTGLHFDFMKIDDLVTEGSVSNETQINASKEYYSGLRQLFDNPTLPKEDIIGTIYHFNDLYADLIKNETIVKSIIPAATDYTFENRIFPERFSLEGLQTILNDPTIGPYKFGSQYMLNPRNPKDVKFFDEWLKFYDTLPEGLAEYICVDPASTQKKKSDYTVIERWGVDFEGKHYLLEGVRDKLSAYQRVDRVLEIAGRARNLKHIKYEVLGGRHGDIEMLHQAMGLKKKYYIVKETKSTSASKTDRIEQRLVGVFHAGLIFFPRTLNFRSEYDGKAYDFVQLYKLEFLQFPFTEHDDILDCHSQMFEEGLILGSKAKAPQSKDDEFMWWRQQAIEAKHPKQNRYIFGIKAKRLCGIPVKLSYR